MPDVGNHRRRFLSSCTGVLIGVIGLLSAVPILGYCLAPLRRKRDEEAAGASFVDLGPLEDLPIGEWKLLSLEMVQHDGWEEVRQRHAVWVHRPGESGREVAVLSPICSHLGCPINWYPDQSRFLCPCHGGVFDADGRHRSGPPLRSMDPLDFQIRVGRLWVRWQDFKIGVARRVPIPA